MGLLNENIPLYKKPLDISVTITDSSLLINGEAFPVDVQQAKSQSDIGQIFTKVFEASDKSYFSVGRVSVANSSSFENPFIPMSVLKQVRRSFYQI